MLSSDIIKFLRPYADEGLFVYADSADPRLIDEVALGGIIIYGAQKGAGSILAGIDKMQTFEIFTTRKSIHLQSEFRNYIWAKDKDGRYINTPEDHDNHCFTADTLILTNQGYKQIKDINVGDVVYNSDGWHRVSKTFDNGIQEVWKTIIELDDRTIEINSTPSHKFKTKEGWKLLQGLTEKDVLYIFRNKNIVEQKIKRIKIVRKYKEHVYNMEVEGEHEYFANDILVSNCIDAARYYTLAVLLGKVMKPRNIDKKDLGVF